MKGKGLLREYGSKENLINQVEILNGQLNGNIKQY